MIPQAARSGTRRLGVGPTSFAIALLALVTSPMSSDAARWNWSGSVAVDHLNIVNDPTQDSGEPALAKTGTTVEWSLKATVDLSDQLSANGKICTACHGLTVEQAYAELRFKPLLNLEAGRIKVPFGDFYLRTDPANDAFLSKPLPYAMGHMLRFQSDRFNLGVVPMPYVDHGVSLFGDVWVRDALQIWYALYAVNGFSSTVARDFTFKNQVAEPGLNDNNERPSWGTRLSLAQGPFAVGGSYIRGAYDPSADFDYEIWGVDASVYFFGARLRGEYLERQTDVLENDARRNLTKKGFFGQLEVPIREYLAVVGRFDGLLREGAPVGTVNDESSGIIRWTYGVNVMPSVDYSFRLQFEHWRFTDFAFSHVLHLGLVIAY
jgi:hypothetical protein